jgi:uridine kinase
MNRPYIIAIAGGTASGKSTLADALAARLGAKASSISHDCYYKTVPGHVANHPDRATLYNYDHPSSLDSTLLAEHLRELRAGRAVRIPRYDYATSQAVPEASAVEPRQFILVDGILILAEPDLIPLFDLIVFVDAPDDVRLVRRIRRDTTVRGQTLNYVLDQYMNTVKPMHDEFVAPSKQHAHVILDGTLNGLATAVVQEIRARCACRGMGVVGAPDCPDCFV